MEFDVYCEFDSEHGWTVIQRYWLGSRFKVQARIQSRWRCLQVHIAKLY